jgi:hypothetical protein
MSFTADILNQCGVPSVGTKLNFLIAEAHDVNTLPAPVGVTKEISADITCKTTKKFIKVEAVIDTAGMVIEASGDPGFQSIATKFGFALKKIDLAKNNFFDTLIGCGIICLVPDKNTAGYWVLGDTENPAFLTTGTADTGKKSGDKNWYQFEITHNGNGTPYLYTGDIDSLLVAAA